jgi:hypothetical protein
MIAIEQQQAMEKRLNDCSPLLVWGYIEASMTDNKKYIPSSIN